MRSFFKDGDDRQTGSLDQSDVLTPSANIPLVFEKAVKVALRDSKHDKEYLEQLRVSGIYKTSLSLRVYAAGSHGMLAKNGLTESLKKLTDTLCKDGGKSVPTDEELKRVI